MKAMAVPLLCAPEKQQVASKARRSGARALLKKSSLPPLPTQVTTCDWALGEINLRASARAKMDRYKCRKRLETRGGGLTQR